MTRNVMVVCKALKMLGLRCTISYFGRDVGDTRGSSAGSLVMHLLSTKDHYQQLSDS